MTPHAVKFGVTASDLCLFSSVRDAVVALTEPDLGRDENGSPIVLSCHIICRAVRRLVKTGVKVEDGFFCGGYQHSWLRLQSGNILDIYPVAVASGPILWDGKFPSPAHHLFRKAQLQTALAFSAPEFRRSVSLVARALALCSTCGWIKCPING